MLDRSKVMFVPFHTMAFIILKQLQGRSRSRSSNCTSGRTIVCDSWLSYYCQLLLSTDIINCYVLTCRNRWKCCCHCRGCLVEVISTYISLDLTASTVLQQIHSHSLYISK